MWARYNQSAVGPVATCEAHEWGAPVTPFSRYPLQDAFYNTLVGVHIAVALVYLPLMIYQYVAKKGDQNHVKRGLALKWIAILMIGGGWALQIRHSWFSNPQVFEEHPVLFRLDFARAFVSAFGSSTVVSALNVYLVGVKDESRKMVLASPSYFVVVGATLMSWAIIINCIAFMVKELLKVPVWSSYHWEMLWEMAVIGSVFPVYDGCNLFALAMWWRTGCLNYVEHHVMNAVWTMSKTCAAVLLFSAHDAQWFWPHPGLHLFQRLAVQLVPQLCILGPYILRIMRYIAKAPTYTPSAGATTLCMAEMPFAKRPDPDTSTSSE
mmetsp:Transcript_3951/g.7067  ORF Transcript_3951/g.7067 Transcript_3951/m.7067 type:complete len:323 (+) Transcript_3951:64-1032(+)